MFTVLTTALVRSNLRNPRKFLAIIPLMSLGLVFSRSNDANEIPGVSFNQGLNNKACFSTATYRNQDRFQYEITLVKTGELIETPGEVEFFQGNQVVRVFRDRYGRSYIRPIGGHRIAVYNDEGVYSHTIGRPGQGPGELSKYILPVAFDEEDHLWVYDPSLYRAIIYTYEGEFIRNIPLLFIPQNILEDGNILGVQIVRSSSSIGYPIHLANSDGEFIKSFGRETPEYRPDQHYLYDSVGALWGTNEIWLCSVGHYELQLWDMTHERLQRTVSPNVRWFRDTISADRDYTRERPTDLVTSMFVDKSGIVWVLIQTSDLDWKRPANVPEIGETPITSESRAQLLDWVVQAIDSESGIVVAERRFDELISFTYAGGEIVIAHENVDVGVGSIDIWQPVLSEKENIK